MRTARYFAVSTLSFISFQNGPAGEQTHWPQKIEQRPLLPTNHNQEHNTVGTHSIIFEMVFGLLWPFTIPNKYIHRGAQWTSPNGHAVRTPRQVHPL